MNVKAGIITIGNEILLGKTLNSNQAWLGNELSGMGIDVCEAITIKDETEEIESALERCWTKYDIVISTGGLGPTEDDVTKSAIANFFGKELYFVSEIWEEIRQRSSLRGMKIAEIYRNQALVPHEFKSLKNEMGTAPGLYYEASGKLFFALQGVPIEMKHVFDQQIRPILHKQFPRLKTIYQRTIHIYGIAESALAEIIHKKDLPNEVDLAWLPQTGRLDLRLISSNTKALAEAESILLAKSGEYVWGFDQDSPASVLLNMLESQNMTLAVAESCTAGLLQAYIADIPGASKSLLGGVISYANSVKEEVLQVRDLQKYSAVSKETAIAMAKGVQSLCHSDVAVSITGIAGPEGGTPQKPVGTVHMAFCIKNMVFHKMLLFTGDRASIRHKTAEAAMLLLIKMLQGKEI
nr:nicotinamide-nucleotide amidase [Candidatus Cloacimonadota bacterium]